MTNSTKIAGVKLRFVDQRKRSKSLAFRIFHAKKGEKTALYPLHVTTLKQVERSVEKVSRCTAESEKAQNCIAEIEYYCA